MAQPLLMPKLGLTMTEGMLAEWSVAVGSSYKTGETLFVVETDKVATEIAAEADGVLSEIVVQVGDTVPVGATVAMWSEAGVRAMATTAPAKTAAAVQQTAPAASDPKTAASPSITPATSPGARIPVTPLARRVATQLQVDLSAVQGSGPRGRIKAVDVQNAAGTQAGTQANTNAGRQAGTQAGSQPGSSAPSPAVAVKHAGGFDAGVRSKPTSIQSATARRLTEVKQQVPHFYLAVDAEVSALVKLRAELNDMQEPGAARLTLNHFILAAAGRALKDLPDANRVWSDGDIVTFGSTDVGMAVNTDRGLFVPVVRDAGRISLNALASQARQQVQAARAGTLGRDDFAGGAITVSNAGMFNVKFMTPIINPGHAMILGVGSITSLFRPDAAGQPALHQEMGLVLAADHRILDGVSGLTFLNRVVAYLERPMTLLLGA